MVHNINVAEQLRWSRLLKSLSQVGVAGEVGIHPVTLNRYERDIWKPLPEKE